MHSFRSFVRAFLLVALLCFFPRLLLAQGQTGDVVRINTELVQTDVTVLDKKGRFVEGLSLEQFELTLDGKPQPISFFERVRTGSAQEAAQVAAARRGAKAAPVSTNAASTADNGRVILFFLDDVHLSGDSLARARLALLDFVDKRMRPGDQVAIVSTSGQIGFLQQLTDNEAVLREAIARLNYKRNPETYSGRTVITDYQANQVAEHSDSDLFNYLVSSTMNEFQLVAPKGGDSRGLGQIAANSVRNRVQQIQAQARAVTSNTLSSLMGLMRSSAQLPGRKLVFFISDGFITDVRGSGAMTMLKRVTEMAARVGIVVFTMDVRGTYSDPAVDAGSNVFPDGLGSGRSARNPSAEASAMREPLRILADDTGGRALLNSNSIPDSIQQALDETSVYYLLAWRPDTDEQRSGRARLKVTIKDRPDLRVRLRRNYYTAPAQSIQSKQPKETPDSASTPATAATKLKPEAELLTTLASLYPQRTLPTSLAVGYLNTPDQGLVLKLSMQIERWAFDSETSEGAQKREIDVIGAAVDDRGVIVSFKQLLTIAPDSTARKQGLPALWNQQLRVPAGLYQVRVAVRERGSGRTGSAQQWIEVPDLAQRSLQLSSLFLAERQTSKVEQSDAMRTLMVDVDHRFARGSVLRYQTYIYNAARGNTSAPDVEIQTRVLRDNHVVVTMPSIRVPTAMTVDQSRLPYWAEISLADLPPGRYLLQVTATDRATKMSVMQRTRFSVE